MQNYCQRYYTLRDVWVRAWEKARQNGVAPEKSAECCDALTHLRAHAEVCSDCKAALFSAFPETVGKVQIMLSVEGA
jgi:hypothetical protein